MKGSWCEMEFLDWIMAEKTTYGLLLLLLVSIIYMVILIVKAIKNFFQKGCKKKRPKK